MEEVFLRNQLKPLCRGLGVAVFFGSFSSAVRRNERMVKGFALFRRSLDVARDDSGGVSE